jgi:hypothetical protein
MAHRMNTKQRAEPTIDRKRRRQERRRWRWRRRAKGRHAVYAIEPPAGRETAAIEDCACPVCHDIAAQGLPVTAINASGQLVEIKPRPRPMIEVSARGDATTWPDLSIEPRALSVPSGCTAGDFVEYVRYKTPALWSDVPGSMRAIIDGEECEPTRVLTSRELVTVSRRWLG